MSSRSSTPLSSRSSTPLSKKRKTTWSTLLSDVDANLIPEGVCLETTLLSNDAGEAEVFGLNTDGFHSQRVYLENLFKGNEALVESIIDSIKTNTGMAANDVDKLKCFSLPPSAPPSHSLNVANALFRLPISNYDSLLAAVFSTAHTSSANPETSGLETSALKTSSTSFVDYQCLFNENMLHYRKKKASGVPLLGTFILHISGLLNKAISGCRFSSDMEFVLIKENVKVGMKPACDVAIVHEVDRPVLLVEYKPKLDTRCGFVETNQLMEVMIQAYYCLYQHPVTSVIHCLTDLQQWWYFKVDKERPRKLKVAWFKSINEPGSPFEFLPAINIASHFNFLCPVIKDLL